MISVRFQGKPFNTTVIQSLVYATTSNTEEAEVEWFYEDIQAEKSIDLYPHEHSGKNTQQNNFKSNKA